MPVTTKPSPRVVGIHSGRIIDVDKSAEPLLKITLDGCQDPYLGDIRRPNGAKRTLLSSSFDQWDVPQTTTKIAPFENGFVDGLIHAFENDLHLVIRPDDVWLSILTQFSMYVNGNAELVRRLFVVHEGKKDLVVDVTPFPLSKVDFGRFAQEMASVIQENVVDSELKSWMLPSFSTTEDHDKSVASFVMMGTLQKYFNYMMKCGCGLPSVTLLGERSDWEEIQRKLDKLPTYGPEPAEWAEVLRVVLRYMIKTFDNPDSREVKNFWLRVCHTAGREGSRLGVKSLSGWITAFSFWNEEGKRRYAWSDEELSSRSQDWDVVEDRKRLILDGLTFPIISKADISKGVVTLPVTLVDLEKKVNRYATVLAGSVGMTLSKRATTVQPLSGWWILQEFERPLEGPAVKGSWNSLSETTTAGPSDVDSIYDQ